MKKKILSLILVSLFLCFNAGYTQNNEHAQSALAKANHQFFIENKGQWPDEVLYLTRINGLDAWITKKGVLYTFYKLEENKNVEEKTAIPNIKENEGMLIGHRVWMKLQNQNQNVLPEGKEKQAAYHNYFIGNNLSKHAANVGLYNQALVKNVYNGIDIRYYFDNGNLRYDYIVQPGADASQIKFTLEGSDKTYINKQGNLAFTTRFGEVQLAELKTYQQNNNKTIASKFAASGQEKNGQDWCISLAPYDHSQTLIIDPLIYSTYIGGANADQGFSIAIDASGNTYITGKTGSADYDITAGAFQITNALANDAFVTKLNATGTALLYSTYIGGSGFDQGSSIAINGATNFAFITGATGSTNYPTTAGVFQSTKVGTGNDAFVTKLNATGTALTYSTYIGGGGDDGGTSITIGTLGNACITGFTNSTDYDITAGAFQTVKDVNYDVFVTRLNTAGTTLIYSTYIGGGSAEFGNGITIDASGNTYITGYTASSDYDITAGAFQTTKGGLDDVFITKLNATGTALLYSTYIGGSSIDRANSIAIDGSGNAYVTGSASNFYNTTAGAFQTGQQGGNDAFVTKLNPSGTALVYSTYIGGSLEDRGNSIAVDGNGNTYITGYTYSTNFDITAGAFQTTHVGTDDDVFVTILNKSGTTLLNSTYIGGTGLDAGNSIAIDGSGNAYITGFTFSSNYDITAGAFQTVYGAGGFDDVFVSKLCLSGSLLSSAPSTNSQSVCVNTPVINIIHTTFGSTGIGAVTGLPTGVIANWSGGTITISGTPTVGGTFNYTIPLTGGCGTGNATGTITVISTPVTPAFAAVPPICSGAVLAALPTTSTNTITGTWSPAIDNTTTTTYTFTPAPGQCANTTTMTITVTPTVTPTFVLVDTICSGSTLAPLPTTSTNGITGTWSPAINNTVSTNYYFTPTAGQCVTNTTISHAIWVNSTTVTPTFFAVNPICSGAVLAALSTISTNSITGTWSPALNNTSTTTYTFTPAATECTTTTTTLSITVTPNVTPTFAAVSAVCSGSVIAALPTTSTNGITGTWSPAIDNTATTTYTFTPTAGQCATTTTLSITVTPEVTPSFAAVPAICSGAALAALPTTSTNGVTGSWSPAINNTATTTYTFTPAAGQCATTTTLTITVNSTTVTPTFAAAPSVCSGSAIAALPTTSTNGITGTWSPALNNTATTTYTFTPSAGQCATTTTLSITVTPNVTPTFSAVAAVCSGSTIAALPTTSTNGVTGTWSPAINNTATTTYTFTPSAGQCATTTTLSIIVNQTDVASISYANSTFCITENDAPCNITGVTGGAFSSSPFGLTLNASTGVIGVNTSSENTYTVTYTTTGTCPTTSNAIVIIDLCTGIEVSEKDYIKVYPNPSTEKITIKLQQKGLLEIYNLLGEKVLEKIIDSNETTQELSFTNAGTYICKFSSDKETNYLKFIITK